MQPEQDDVDPVALVEAFAAGDERALAAVYTRWSPLVYSVALAALGSVGEAERVTQSVFTGAWADRCQFDPSRTRLSTWLIGRTGERISEVRAGTTTDGTTKGTEGPPGGPATMSSAGGTIDPADQIDRLLVADGISHLDEMSRRVLRLALFERLTTAEIAERTHLSAAAVTKHLQQSLLTLRERLEVKTDAR